MHLGSLAGAIQRGLVLPDRRLHIARLGLRIAGFVRFFRAAIEDLFAPGECKERARHDGAGKQAGSSLHRYTTLLRRSVFSSASTTAFTTFTRACHL